MAAAPRRLRIDLHAHPGRYFLVGVEAGDPARGADLDGALRQLRAGRVTACSFATVADMRVIRPQDAGMRAVREFETGEAAADHERQISGLLAFAEANDIRLALGPGDLLAAGETGELAMVLACEGGDFLDGEIAGLQAAYGRGVRTVQLVHYRVNELGDIQTEDSEHNGLTAFGGEVVTEMNRLGMVIDLAHAPWSVARAVLKQSSSPVMVSHSHLATGADAHPRLVSDEHALAVAAAGGVIGAWPSGVVLGTFDDYLDEIVRMVGLLGAAHVGIGTDMDGNYEPVMTTYEQFYALETGLGARGVSEADIDLVLGGSFVALFEQVVAASDATA